MVTFASRLGGAPTVKIEGLSSAIEMLVHFLPTVLRLEFVARAASADCNGDAVINDADFAALETYALAALVLSWTDAGQLV